jgi:hypothetical protein
MNILKKLKKTIKYELDKPVKTKISFDETLERFFKRKSKVITISDLQHEISNVKKEILDLKQDMIFVKANNQDRNRQLLMMNLQKTFQEQKIEDLKIEQIFDNQQEHSNDPSESSNAAIYSNNDMKFVKFTRSFIPPKWYSNVTIIVTKDFSFDAIALIDYGSNMNCIQEGLVPSKYFEKSNEKLNSASGDTLHIKYELSKAYVYQNDVYFPIPSVLVKNMSIDKVIIETLSFIYFISSLLLMKLVSQLLKWVQKYNLLLHLDWILN